MTTPTSQPPRLQWWTATTPHGTHTLASLGAVNGIAVLLRLDTGSGPRAASTFSLVRAGTGALERLVMIGAVNHRDADPAALRAQADTEQGHLLTVDEAEMGRQGQFCPACGAVLDAGVCRDTSLHAR